MMKTFQRVAIGAAVVAIAVAFWISTLETPAPAVAEKAPAAETNETVAAAEPWIPAASNIWTGVKLYYGPKKMKVGEVLGGSDGLIKAGDTKIKGVLVKMANGESEWKSREAIVTGAWYVRTDDPALKAMHWKLYSAK